MAYSILVAILSLFCLLLAREYHLNQCASSSTINEMLNSKDPEDELPSSC